MTMKILSKWSFLASGMYALLCIPVILVAERLHWPEGIFHATQFLSVAVCIPASFLFLWLSRGTWSRLRWLALSALILAGAWFSFAIYVITIMDSGWD